MIMLMKKKLDNILKSLFSTNFFEDIKINLTNNTLKIDVQEYPVINQLILVGEKRNKTKEEIKKIIRLKEKSSFIKSYLSGDIATIKRLYSTLGYNFAKVDAKVNEISEKNFDILIEIDRGNQTKISSIRFIGDKKVKEKRLRDKRDANFEETLL